MSIIDGKTLAIYVLKNVPFLQIFISQPNSEKNTKNTFSKNAYFKLAPRKMENFFGTLHQDTLTNTR